MMDAVVNNAILIFKDFVADKYKSLRYNNKLSGETKDVMFVSYFLTGFNRVSQNNTDISNTNYNRP